MSRNYVDFEAVKAANPIENVARMFDIQWQERNSQLRAACPSGNGGPRSLCVTPAKGKFYCWACEAFGDAIQLVAHLQGVDVKTAAQWLQGNQNPPEKQGNGADGARPREIIEPEPSN